MLESWANFLTEHLAKSTAIEGYLGVANGLAALFYDGVIAAIPVQDLL
jgi:hypothetical protein